MIDINNGLRVFNKIVVDGLNIIMSGMSYVIEFIMLIVENYWWVVEELVEVFYIEYLKLKG